MILIKIHYRTDWGESLVITGEHESLGFWNPLKGKRLNYIGEGYWETMLFPPFPKYLKFKFVVCKENDYEMPLYVLRWEEGENHVLDYSAVADKTVLLFWGFPHLQVSDCSEKHEVHIEEQKELEKVKKVEESTKKSMDTFLINQKITTDQKKYTYNEIQKGKQAGDFRHIALESISNELSKCGIDFALTSDPSKSNLLNLPLLASPLTHNSECFEIKIPEDNQKNIKFEDLEQNPKAKEIFKEDLRKKISEALNCPIDNVIILNIAKGSISVDILILEVNQKNKNLGDSHVDIIKQQMVGKLIGTFGKIDIRQREKTYLLSLDDFDSRGDFQFPNDSGDIQKRGGLDYYQPNNQFFRKGLKVLDKYPQDGWLNMDGNPNEWAVAFHGISSNPDFVLPKVINEGMREGPAQAYADYICQRSGQRVGVGVYCTPNINVALTGYTSQKMNVQGKNYSVIMQCRVKPSAIKWTQAQDYWVINDPKDIRPYGIIFKKY